MKRLIQFAAISLTPCLMGGMCAPPPDSVLSANFTGVVAPCHQCPDRYSLVEAAKTTVKGDALDDTLVSGSTIQTEQFGKVKITKTVAGETIDYQAVFGHSFDTSGEIKCDVREVSGKPALFLYNGPPNGWALGWGDYPIVHTTIVNAGSDTTTIMVQQINATTHRVFLIGGADMYVVCDPNTYPLSGLGRNNKGKYVDLTTACTNPGTGKDVDDGNDSVVSPIEEFVCQATRVAFAAGMPGTQAPGWPMPPACTATCPP